MASVFSFSFFNEGLLLTNIDLFCDSSSRICYWKLNSASCLGFQFSCINSSFLVWLCNWCSKIKELVRILYFNLWKFYLLISWCRIHRTHEILIRHHDISLKRRWQRVGLRSIILLHIELAQPRQLISSLHIGLEFRLSKSQATKLLQARFTFFLLFIDLNFYLSFLFIQHTQGHSVVFIDDCLIQGDWPEAKLCDVQVVIARDREDIWDGRFGQGWSLKRYWWSEELGVDIQTEAIGGAEDYSNVDPIICWR